MSDQSRHRLKLLAPFALAALLAFVVTPVPQEGVLWFEWGLALALVLAIVPILLTVPWRRVSPWWSLIPVLMYLASVGLLREAGGGGNVGIGVMVLLPVIWLALHGARKVLAVTLIPVALVYWAPILIVGAPRYSDTGWRLGFMITVLGGLMGFTVQGLHTRERRLSERLGELAHSDDLTGLPNRRAWDAALTSALSASGRREEPVCVAMIDLDGFKAINDTAGHAAGDRLLRRLADDWRESLRGHDLLARLGGDEFGLLLTGTTRYEAQVVLGRMRASSATSWSFGIAEWDRTESAAALERRADSALYRSKRAEPAAR